MSLELHWIALILLSALIHASWNALNKASRDPLQSMGIISATGGLAAAALIPFAPPLGRAAWPWLAASAVLHLVYQLSLVRMYRVGDLSQVYPIARGLAPLGVALFAALTVGELPSPRSAFGLLLAAAAIASLAAGPGGLPALARLLRSLRKGAGPAVAAALQTALLISLYTVVDGNGVRAGGSAFAYAVWMAAIDAVPMLAVVLAVRGRAFLAFARTDGLRNTVGGVLATLGYSIVLFAMGSGAMASVASLRETSVVFAALIGTRLLGESFGRERLLASAALALGLVLVQTG